MVPTFSFDDGGVRKSPVDITFCRSTIVFWTGDGERIVADSPFDGPSAPEGLRRRLGTLIACNHNKWETYFELFVRHSWSNGVWRKAALDAARRYWLPKGSNEDVVQIALLRFCELLKARIDILAFFEESLDHFEPWFRTIAFNLSSAAARSLPVFSNSQAVLNPDWSLDAFLQNIADYRSNESGDRWNRMVAVLARYPLRTKAVVLLRAHAQTWSEVAATLRITVEAARWAVEAYRDQLRRDFASFQ